MPSRDTERVVKTAHRMSKTDPLPEMLLRCRVAHDMTLEDAARACGLTLMTLSYVERGIRMPRRDTRLRIENFLAKHGFVVPKKVA
jgi:transcriptional regulator with XRE-family HTH domain